MHVFIAGVMQGSRLDPEIDSQDYRVAIVEALKAHFPHTRVTDPWAMYPDSVGYDLERLQTTFIANTSLAAEADLLIAYLPHASMGTAIEMWTAYHNNAYIVAVTPMTHNWVVRITADEVLPDLESLLAHIASGKLAENIAARNGQRQA
ncbi:MAG: hypothetical protein GX579_00600 [Chloroflexi bacterium]|jgi:hypothetical protein|nr:hypothetical protein [Chloroflexota bacterium]